MKVFRQHTYIRFLWLAMALHILNVSVDTTDMLPMHLPEDLSINDRESLIELLLEDMLGFQEAVGEHDEADSEEAENLIAKKFFACQPLTKISSPSRLSLTISPALTFSEYANPFVASVYTELISPPPQVKA